LKSSLRLRLLKDPAKILEDSSNILQLNPHPKILEIFRSKNLSKSHFEIVPIDDPLRILERYLTGFLKISKRIFGVEGLHGLLKKRRSLISSYYHLFKNRLTGTAEPGGGLGRLKHPPSQFQANNT